MLYSIFPIRDDVTRHHSLLSVHHNLWVVQLLPLLSRHTVIARGWAGPVRVVGGAVVSPSRQNITQKHGSAAIGTFCVVVTLGGVWSEIDSLAEALEADFPPDTFHLESRAGNPTDSAVHVRAEALRCCDVTGQRSPVKVLCSSVILLS